MNDENDKKDPSTDDAKASRLSLRKERVRNLSKVRSGINAGLPCDVTLISCRAVSSRVTITIG